MKEFWVEVRPFDKETVTTALESGVTALVLDESAPARALGRVRTCTDGDLVPGRDVVVCEIAGTEDQEEAFRAAQAWLGDRPDGGLDRDTPGEPRLPVRPRDRRSQVSKEAELALGVLERGVAGVLLENPEPAEIRAVASVLRKSEGTATMVPFTVTSVRSLGMGDRVCVDTCTMMADGEGLLVGNTSSAFLLVHAETLENPTWHRDRSASMPGQSMHTPSSPVAGLHTSPS